MKYQTGVSLTEVLVGLFLASVILITLIQLYLNSKKEYLETEKIIGTHFELLWVSDLLSDSIRRAGFTPCLGIDRLQIIDHRSHKSKIQALRIQNQPDQFIQINRMNEYFTKIIKIQDATKIWVQNPAIFHKKRPIIIADCGHAEVHEISDMHQFSEYSLITLDGPLFFIYDTSAYMGEFLEEKWFIKKNPQNIDTLHYTLLQTEEVTPLVHSVKTRNRRIKEKQFLEITLGLDENKIQELRVLVRGS